MQIHRTWTARELDALMKRVLAALPGPADRAMSTPMIRTAFPELDAFEKEHYVRQALDKLTTAGWATRLSVTGDRRVFWRRTTTGEEGKNRGALPPAY